MGKLCGPTPYLTRCAYFCIFRPALTLGNFVWARKVLPTVSEDSDQSIGDQNRIRSIQSINNVAKRCLYHFHDSGWPFADPLTPTWNKWNILIRWNIAQLTSIIS